MAIAPLKIATPTVPLIGGKELPKASGEGVRVADISNSFAQLSSILQAQAEEGDALDDKLKAEYDAEIYRNETVGKDPLNRYTKPPVIKGSVPYRIAATAAIERDAMADIRSIYTTQAGEIQIEPNTPTDQKLVRIKNIGNTIVDQIAPGYRQQAREYILADITQREAQLRGEDARRHDAAVEFGQKTRIDNAYDQGVSAAAAGADWTQHTREIRAVLAEKVASGDMLPETATDIGNKMTNLVVAEGFHRTISTEAMKGNIGAADLLEFGVAMDTGAPATLYADRPYEPGLHGAIDRFDTGQTKKDPGKKEIISADKYKQLIGDPATSKAIANNIQELARHLAAGQKANEKDMQLWKFVEESQVRPSTVLPETLKTTYNEKVTQAIIEGHALDNAEGQAYLKMLTRATKVMAPELIRQLQARTQGTYQEAMNALNIYNELTTGINGNTQQGQIILQSVNAGDAALFDTLTDYAADVLRQTGGDDKASAELWRRGQTKLADKNNSEDFFANDFAITHEAAGNSKSLNSAILEMSRDHYGRTSMDPQILAEARAAYRNSMILSSGIEPDVALEKVMQRIFNRYTASPIFVGGAAPVEKWENPDIDGYRNAPSYGPVTIGAPIDPNLWVNDFVTGQLHNFVASGQISTTGMSAEGIKTLNDALVVTDDIPLGRTIFLEPVAGNRAHTQFKVVLSMENGASTETVMVTDENGRPTPLLLDPGIILSNINNRKRASGEIETDIEEGNASFVQARNRDIIAQIRKTDGPGTPSDYAIINDPEIYKKWFATQDPEFRKHITDLDISHAETLARQQQRYMELQVTPVPEGMHIDPKLLGTPKAAGKGIVLGAVNAVGDLFGDSQNTRQFLVNVAAAESDFGSADGSFRASGDRGLWQVNDSPTGAFMEIQRRAAIAGDPIAVAAAKAKSAFGIDVATLTPTDLDKPLVSALMARMYFMRTQEAIPADAEGQGEFWRTHYNPAAPDSYVDNFVRVANSLLVTPAYASTSSALEAGGPGLVTDMAGNAYPANFTATLPYTQTSLLALSAAFGQPLRVTPHGGTQADRRRWTSQHHKGTAIDIYVADMSDADKTRLIAMAISMGYRGIGGYGAGDGVGTIHLDLRHSGKHGGLALWWRHRAGKDSDWTTGQKWFVDGVRQGSAMKGLNLG